MNTNGDSHGDKELLDKASSWVERHPGDYGKIVEECNRRAENGNKKIYVVDVLSHLIWFKKINITRSYAESMTLYLLKKEPGLKDKLVLNDEDEGIDYSQVFNFIKLISTTNA